MTMMHAYQWPQHPQQQYYQYYQQQQSLLQAQFEAQERERESAVALAKRDTEIELLKRQLEEKKLAEDKAKCREQWGLVWQQPPAIQFQPPAPGFYAAPTAQYYCSTQPTQPQANTYSAQHAQTHSNAGQYQGQARKRKA